MEEVVVEIRKIAVDQFLFYCDAGGIVQRFE